MPFNAWTDSSLITSNLERFLLGDSSPATPARPDRCRLCQLHTFSQAPWPPLRGSIFHKFTSALLVSRMCGKYCDPKTIVKANNEKNEARRENTQRRKGAAIRPMRGKPLPRATCFRDPEGCRPDTPRLGLYPETNGSKEEGTGGAGLWADFSIPRLPFEQAPYHPV